MKSCLLYKYLISDYNEVIIEYLKTDIVSVPLNLLFHKIFIKLITENTRETAFFLKSG